VCGRGPARRICPCVLPAAHSSGKTCRATRSSSNLLGRPHACCLRPVSLISRVQEQKEKGFECNCRADLHDGVAFTQHVEHTLSPHSGLTGNPYEVQRHVEVTAAHDELQYAQHIKQDNLASRSFQEYHATNHTNISQLNGASPQAASWLQLFNVVVPKHVVPKDAPSRLHQLDLVLLLLFWVPVVLLALFVFCYPVDGLFFVFAMVQSLVERLFWMLFHKGPFLGEPLDEEEAAAIEKSGIAPPPDRIWYVDWDDLTPGQRFVFGELGVHDEQRWILACGRHRLLPDQNSTGGFFVIGKS